MKAAKCLKTIGGKNGTRQYVLQQTIGQGSFGKVYHSPPYAVKEVTFNAHPHMKLALKKETDILRRLSHPNIVRLVDIIQEGNSLYMVMEHCEQDLSKYLRNNKLDERQAIQIIRQVASGLNFLVNKGFVHRDLKPANILVTSKNQFKLADFGLAKYVEQFDSSLLQTIAGSPLYMAPQILRKSSYTTKCDIWSAGVIFYELLTGRPPWMASNEMQLYINITTKPLVIPGHLSEWSKTLLARMLVISENARIGWEELFDYIKNQGRPQSRSRSKAKEQRPSSAAKSEKSDKSQRTLGDKSAQKLPKWMVSYQESELRDLFYYELVNAIGQPAASKIVRDSSYRPSKQEVESIKEVMSFYKTPYQEWLRRQFGSLKEVR